MTHFAVLTIIGTVDPADAADRLDAMLAPYDETLEVAPRRESISEEDAQYYDDLTRDPDGSAYRMTTANPNAKWDWWALGGRWTGLLKLRTPEAVGVVGAPGLMTRPPETGTVDLARVGDIERDGLATSIAAMLTPEGWEEPAKTGWFGVTYDRTESDDAWRERVAGTLASLDPRTVVAVVDCHI